MQKRLNIPAVKTALERNGLNAAALAKQLDVSREGVSKWLSGEALPRPDKLLRLSSALKLSFADMMIVDEPHAPRIAFRKARGTRTTEEHVTRAQEMGRMLRQLVPYLPFDKFVTPPVLKEPAVNHAYLQQVAASVRRQMGVTEVEPVTFPHLVKRFSELQTVLIPVLWGKKGQHENATHIHLPDSMTTWVYLNLDVQAHDFLFWMAHELGHSLSPSLEGEFAEDFADAFAGALLFPDALAQAAYSQLNGKPPGAQVNAIKYWAERYSISPFCIYKQTNSFARQNLLREVDLEASIHGATTNFNRAWMPVSHALFGAEPPKPEDYVKKSKAIFETSFFDALGTYVRAAEKGPGFVQTVLNINAVDAKAIHAEIA